MYRLKMSRMKVGFGVTGTSQMLNTKDRHSRTPRVMVTERVRKSPHGVGWRALKEIINNHSSNQRS